MKLVYRGVIAIVMVVGMACIEAPSDAEPGDLQDVSFVTDTGNGSMDAGEVDSGEGDAGEVDAGEVDSGGIDAGEECEDGKVKSSAGECVECLMNTDCPDDKPICGEGPKCVECSSTSPCPDSQQCVDGQCSASCTIAGEGLDCGRSQRCNSRGECKVRDFDSPTDASAFCRPCDGDSNCRAGNRCVEWQGEKVCLPAMRDNSCPERLATAFEEKSVEWGDEAFYCAPRENVTCKFIREYGEPCTNTDGICTSIVQHCIEISDENDSTRGGRCTYACESNLDCPLNAECRTPVSDSESSLVKLCMGG